MCEAPHPRRSESSPHRRRECSPPHRPMVRRLTLAPKPVPCRVEDCGESGDAAANILKEGKLLADPLAGLRLRARGSKFWPLADEVTSDEEDEDSEEDGCSSELVQQERTSAVCCCDLGDAQVQLPSVVELTHNVCSLSSVAGSASEKKNTASGRRTGAAAPPSRGMKPWRGPLPPARISPRRTLADALAAALRPGLGASYRNARPVQPPAEVVGGWRPSSSISNFESGRQEKHDSGKCGHTVGSGRGPGCSFHLRLGGRMAHFAFA